MTQLVPQATREQERTKLLEKICNDFKEVCNLMDNIHKDTSQHVEDICQMKLEVSQMQGKAALKSHEATSLQDMIQKDRDVIDWLIEVVKELKSYTNALGQIEVVRERLQAQDFQISELQMRPLMQVLEDWLVRLEDRLEDQHEEIAICQNLVLTPFPLLRSRSRMYTFYVSQLDAVVLFPTLSAILRTSPLQTSLTS